MPIDTDRLARAVKAAGGERRVAVAAGVSHSTVYRAQDPGHYEVSLDTVERLCKATGLAISELVKPRAGVRS